MGRRMHWMAGLLLSCIFISYVYHGRNIFSASVWPMREPKRAVPRVAIEFKIPQTQGWRITSFLGLVLLVWTQRTMCWLVAVGHWKKASTHLVEWSGGPMEVAPIHDQTCHQEIILILKCYQCDFFVHLYEDTLRKEILWMQLWTLVSPLFQKLYWCFHNKLC